jgi:small subunit ribosomal protein S20
VKKRMRQAESARERNRAQRSAMRGAIKKVRTATSAEEATKALKEAEVLLDRAASKRVIHRNAAARLKSRLNKATHKK